MNYQHAFHAGNFADVHKHVVLARMLDHLRAKPAAFRVIDSHAGAGRYDLLGPEATVRRMARRHRARLSAAAPDLRQSAAFAWSDLTSTSSRRSIPGGALRVYPGSPLIAKALLRPQDRLIACELEPRAARCAQSRVCAAIRASRSWRSTAGSRSTPTCRRRSAAASC